MAIRSAETYFDPRDNQAKLARGVGLVKDDRQVDPIRHARAGGASFHHRMIDTSRASRTNPRFAPPIAQIDFKDQI
jgi:hypothetical protein